MPSLVGLGFHPPPGRPKALSIFVCLFVCLFVTLLNVRVCVPDFATKALEYRYRNAHCKVYGHSMVSCAKTAEPIEMPFVCELGLAQGIVSRSPHGNGQFSGGGRVVHCKV